MRILITTGLGEREVGGPFQYGPRLREAFQALGHEVRLVSYGRAEKLLPVGLRHLYFFLKVLPLVAWADALLTLDTFSVGVPSAWASRLLGKNIVARVGGDFLWSAYVNRTGEELTLTKFYESLPKLNFKERLILSLTKSFFSRVDCLAFNTEWQKGLWRGYYQLPETKLALVRNFISVRHEAEPASARGEKVFLWAGRDIPEKNLSFLRRVGERVSLRHQEFKLEIVTGESHKNVLDKIQSSYCVVSPALTDISPNFILEGISYNKPFIMTRETGLSEMYERGGVYLDPKDEEAWVEAMEKMLDPSIYYKYQAELKSVKISHSWREIAEEYLEIWKHL